MEPRALLYYLGEGGSETAGLAFHSSVRVSVAARAGGGPPRHGKPEADIVFLVAAPGSEATAIELFYELRSHTNLPVILALQEFDAANAVQAFRAGVSDVVACNASAEEIAAVFERAGLSAAGARGERSGTSPLLVGKSAPINAVTRYVETIAAGDSTVLITGETGTGKELTAEMVHTRSQRAHKPLVAVNCAAIPETLLESEFFGHVKGAFTGAARDRRGAFLAADGGTILLDEIGEMNAAVQAKLLRVLESRTFRPLGSDRELPVDVRVIAATNQDPERLVRERAFRADLYFRLDVARIHLPPLRTHREDIPLLVDCLMERCAQRQRVPVARLDGRLLDRLMRYDWPGNVRELRNLLEAALATQPGPVVRMEHLPVHWRDRLRTVTNRGDMERSRVLDALTSANWNKTEAARLLSCSRMTLYRKISHYRIVRAGVA